MSGRFNSSSDACLIASTVNVAGGSQVVVVVITGASVSGFWVLVSCRLSVEVVAALDGVVPELQDRRQAAARQAIFGLLVAVDAGLEQNDAGFRGRVGGGQHRQDGVLVA